MGGSPGPGAAAGDPPPDGRGALHPGFQSPFFGSRAEEMTASKRTAVTLSFCYSFREFVFMGAWLRLLADCRAPRRAGELAGILRTELAPSGTRGAFYSVAKEFRLVIRDELSAPLLYS